MSYIKFEARMLNDERWVDAGPAALALHIYALSYCNEQGTDGRISARMAKRVAAPVDPAEHLDALNQLLDLGFWEADDNDGFVLVDYLAHGLSAAEQSQTRAKWAADKDRQRLHRVGNHSLCTPRSKCSAVREDSDLSTGGQVELSTSGKVDMSTADKWTTRPDPTRLDPTLRVGGLVGGRGPGATAAGEAAAPSPPSEEFTARREQRRAEQAAAARESEERRRQAEADLAARRPPADPLGGSLSPEQAGTEVLEHSRTLSEAPVDTGEAT